MAPIKSAENQLSMKSRRKNTFSDGRNGNFKDETGKKFGRLIVVSSAGQYKNTTEAAWRCSCDCGNIVIVNGSNLRTGKTKSCGCLNRDRVKEQAFDLTDRVFGRLKVVRRSLEGKEKWECLCSCGNIKIAQGRYLLSGSTKSCGCLKKDLISNLNKSDKTPKIINIATNLRLQGLTFQEIAQFFIDKNEPTLSLKGAWTANRVRALVGAIQPEFKPTMPICPKCEGESYKASKTKSGSPRYKCKACGLSFQSKDPLLKIEEEIVLLKKLAAKNQAGLL